MYPPVVYKSWFVYFFLLVIIMKSWLFVCTACFNQLQALYFLMLKLSHICPVGSPSGWISFWQDFIISFYRLLLSGATKYARLNLYIPSITPRIYHFSKEPWFFLLRNEIWRPEYGYLSSIGLFDFRQREGKKWVVIDNSNSNLRLQSFYLMSLILYLHLPLLC